MGLSKSAFIAGWQCLKRLYLKVHQPELAKEPDEQSMAAIERGREVGKWARKMFPGGVLIAAGQTMNFVDLVNAQHGCGYKPARGAAPEGCCWQDAGGVATG